MDKTNQGLGPNKLFFWNVLQVYNLKCTLAMIAEDSEPEEIEVLSKAILIYDKKAKRFFHMMAKDGTHQLLIDNASLL